MNRSPAPLPPSFTSKASTREPDDRNTQGNQRRSNLFAPHVTTYDPQVHSNRPPRASFLLRAQNYAERAMRRAHQSNLVEHTRRKKRRHRGSAPRTHPSAVRRPPTIQSRRAQLNPDIAQEKPLNLFQFLSSSHSSSHAPMSTGPAAKFPMLHEVPHRQISNQQPDSVVSTTQKSRVYSASSRESGASYRTEDVSGDEQPRSMHTPQLSRRYTDHNDNDYSIFRPLRTMNNPSTVVRSRVGGAVTSSGLPGLVSDSTGRSSSSNQSSPMGTRTQPTRGLASPIPNPDVLTDARGRNGAKGQPSYSDGNESDVSMEYECHAPAIDVDMDHDTAEVQNSGDSEDEESPVGSSPRVSIHREESPPVIRPPETLRVPRYKVASNMPIPLPKASFTRGRRLLVPSNSAKPIAWLSMPGDMQFIDGTSQ
jgi:hypothetical protein